jgi:hypothetical protein
MRRFEPAACRVRRLRFPFTIPSFPGRNARTVSGFNRRSICSPGTGSGTSVRDASGATAPTCNDRLCPTSGRPAIRRSPSFDDDPPLLPRSTSPTAMMHRSPPAERAAVDNY